MTIPEVVAPERAGFSAERLERVDRIMRRYVEGERLAGTLTLIYRRGHVVHLKAHGHRDRAAGKPMAPDTLLRIYSMTKPITTLAALMLFEQGHFLLDDPIAQYLPAFEDVQVYAGSHLEGMHLVAPERPPTIQDLMRHTAGLSYGWFHDSPVEERYRQTFTNRSEMSLATAVDALAGLPLLYQPGTAWRYSLATDVLGRLVEAVSGESLDTFFHNHIFAPLGMHETGFHVPEHRQDRFAVLYTNAEEFKIGAGTAQIAPDAPLRILQGPAQHQFLQPPTFLSGGAWTVPPLLTLAGCHTGYRMISGCYPKRPEM